MRNEDVEVRAAAAGDVEAITALEQRAFVAPWRREFFDSEILSDGRFNLVARRGDALLGYLFAMWFFDEMHINKIAVAEDARRHGIASMLMERCVAFAKANGIRMISLEVRKSNTSAQEFYRYLEFRTAYIRPRYYPDGEAAVVMMLNL
ncbi:MAG: ribosomal protein S18-alanine N-acetyltransferase [Thermoanaerobaculia bacterium]